MPKWPKEKPFGEDAGQIKKYVQKIEVPEWDPLLPEQFFNFCIRDKSFTSEFYGKSGRGWANFRALDEIPKANTARLKFAFEHK